MKIFILFAFAIVGSSFVSNSQNIQIEYQEGKWQLLVQNKPYFINGVVGHKYLEKVKAYGGNSVRIGSKKEELDKVHDLGLTALVNLPFNAERYGFDFNDDEAVNQQIQKAVEIVEKTKDHPAVMMWAIGNEIDWIPGNKPYNPKLWAAINETAKAIKPINPNHPVMAVIGPRHMQ